MSISLTAPQCDLVSHLVGNTLKLYISVSVDKGMHSFFLHPLLSFSFSKHSKFSFLYHLQKVTQKFAENDLYLLFVQQYVLSFLGGAAFAPYDLRNMKKILTMRAKKP